MTVLKSHKHNIISRSLYIIPLLLLATSCNQRPEGILTNQQMQALLVDIHKTDGVIYITNRRYGHSEEKAICYQNTLDKHGISQAVFDSSLVWYTAHPKRFEHVYDKVLAQIEKELSLATVPHTEELQRSYIEQWASTQSLRIDTLPLKEKEWLRLLLDSCDLNHVKLPKDTLPYLLPYKPDSVAPAASKPSSNTKMMQFIKNSFHDTPPRIIRPLQK